MKRKAVSDISLILCCHDIAPKFYHELKDRSISKFALAVAIALSLCGFVYCGVALFGYLQFGQLTNSDVLTNFANDDNGATFGRLAMSAIVLFTYPRAFNALRTAASALLQVCRM